MTEQQLRSVLRDELANHVEPRLVNVKTAARAIGIAETACYGLLKAGMLRSVKVGRRRLIPVAALDEYVASLVSDAA
jgi:excisionase family DNA binding protein